MQVVTRQCWNCNIVSSVYVAVVLMTFGALGVLSSSPSPPVSDLGEGPSGRQRAADWRSTDGADTPIHEPWGSCRGAGEPCQLDVSLDLVAN